MLGEQQRKAQQRKHEERYRLALFLKGEANLAEISRHVSSSKRRRHITHPRYGVNFPCCPLCDSVHPLSELQLAWSGVLWEQAVLNYGET